MRDVAVAAAVGTMTVSRALRQPEQVSVETRKKIFAAIQKLGYVRNAAAGTLRSSRSKIVAVIVPTISNSIFADTLQAMSDVLRPMNYHLLIGHSGYSLAEEEALVEAFLARQPEALVLTGYTHTPNARAMLKKCGIPVVEIWNIGKKPIDTMIGMSNYDAALEMTRKLLVKGYRAIGYIGGLAEANDRTEQREAGFRAALKEGHQTWIASRVERAPFEFEAGGNALRTLLERHPEIDAIFAASDILAIGAILEAQRMKLRIPDDLGIVGFDDIGIARRISPALTTIRVPRSEIGRAAATEILKRLKNGSSAAKIVNLGFEIIERESTR